MEDKPYILQMKNISKAFSSVVALSDVSLNIKRGEVHALMGENGAGKSTLMKILTGIYQPDRGEIVLKGQKVRFAEPLDAMNAGISIVHQELNSILDMTIAENIFTGREPCRRLGIVNRKEMRRKTMELFRSVDMAIDPDKKLHELSVAEMQMVEIVKAISYNADIIVMDEPTSAITDREVDKLFEIIRKLTSQGKAIIYISHKMSEIYTICDTITVMRDGTYIDTKSTKELDQQKLISLMVGRNLADMYVRQPSPIGDRFLEVKNLSLNGKFKDINLEVRKGEILGIAGLMGAGRTELVEAIFGARKIDGGEIYIQNQKVVIDSPQKAIERGISLVTEDRKLFGLNLNFSVKDNMTLVNLDRYVRFGQIVKFKEEREVADRQMKYLNVKASSRNTMVDTLSGGNQQKVVLAKWLLCNPDLLILDEPTRGIDIGAKSEIYKIINQLAHDGKAIIMVSSEMPELLGMSDRVLVLHEGTITGEFSREDFNQESIMECATGFKKKRLKQTV
ncbi:sugar ABC transporter ATP-binding protein [Paenibacillus abyssi]|uniref:Ribose/galactose/methyl galactoside import ATP-binding protein n=1 Tax=Paenibacillus abyssi TaxID=1340531 RepID=A0A917G4V3_9BACL|nr:sugar ABC transporter ATP-binding protein [Paenibacillus abyssi]GGG22976.1 putative ribose/galactose/methyl galactoside import ATP-binding protein [Paenibacillus abyssi]